MFPRMKYLFTYSEVTKCFLVKEVSCARPSLIINDHGPWRGNGRACALPICRSEVSSLLNMQPNDVIQCVNS